MKYVFRNNTVERFFGKEYAFSGYDDISNVPQDAEGYVWFYQVPIKYDQKLLADEIRAYIDKFGYVLSQVDAGKSFVALTMDVLYAVPFTDDDCRLQEAVAEYNRVLYDCARRRANAKVLDITEFTRNYSASELFDWKFYFLSQMGLNPKLSRDFKAWWERKMDSASLKRKKCLVLDLDNTLWGGVLGEDGIDGIRIGGDYPGKAFLYFQEGLLELARSGVMLAVCSKNNEQDVLDAWERNPFMVLRKEHFVAYRINWSDKASNISALAQELNIGLDSFVFVDDNPTERELIRQMLPMVAVPDFPEQPYGLPVFFKQLVEQYFKLYSVTDEDRKKTEQYKQNAARARAQASFADLDAFLESLDIRITLEAADEFNIQRIAQMTQKTNQFNLTTRRYTDADVRGFVGSGWKIWCIGVADKFGDSGITGCIMVKPVAAGSTGSAGPAISAGSAGSAGSDSSAGSAGPAQVWEIDTFLLSCRVLGKGIEIAFARMAMALLRDAGVSVLLARYLPTAKNAQVRDFWERCGFECIGSDADGAAEYRLALDGADLGIKDIYHTFVK